MASGQLDNELQAIECLDQAEQQQVGQRPDAVAVSGRVMRQVLTDNHQLRQELAQARLAIVHKDELIMEWIAAAQAWKAVSIALREEGQAAADPQHHPLAHHPEQRNRIYREVRRSTHDRLKAQLYPPTSWRPK